MKLGQKKKKAGGGSAKKPEKKAKRKAKGGGKGLANAKTFMVNHVEKVILGAIALVSALIVVSGFAKKGIDTDPAAVRAAINNARSTISSQTWEQVKRERLPEADTFVDRAQQDTIPINAVAYTTSTPFHPRLQKQSKKRPDPTLLAPAQLEVKSGYGGLAIKGNSLGGGISAFGGGTADPNERPIETDQKIPNAAPMSGTYQSRYFVSLTGLVPYKKQFDLYVEAFEDAREYEVERDIPHYLGLEVERAEVQADGSLGAWTAIDMNQARLEMETTWDGKSDEFAASEYVIKELAMPMPPIVRRDVSQWATHSAIPTSEEMRIILDEQRANEARQTNQSQEARGRSSYSSEDEAAMADMAEAAKPEYDVENGMLRFVDMTVEPGKAYRYRTRVVVEDPNNPSTDGRKRPSTEAVETDVLVRLRKTTEPDLRSDWSDPSHVVQVPKGSQVFAGTASMPTMIKGDYQLPRRVTDEPEARILALDWAPNNTQDIPIEIEVRRGAVLNGKAEALEAIDPAKNKIVKLKDHKYATDVVVLDIYGGFDVLDKTDLTAPAQILIWKNGALEFHDESTDASSFELHKILPEEVFEQPPAAGAEATEEPRGRGRSRGRRENGNTER